MVDLRHPDIIGFSLIPGRRADSCRVATWIGRKARLTGGRDALPRKRRCERATWMSSAWTAGRPCSSPANSTRPARRDLHRLHRSGAAAPHRGGIPPGRFRAADPPVPGARGTKRPRGLGSRAPAAVRKRAGIGRRKLLDDRPPDPAGVRGTRLRADRSSAGNRPRGASAGRSVRCRSLAQPSFDRAWRWPSARA